MHPPSFPHEKCPLTPTHPKHTPTHSHQPMKNVHLLSPIQNIPPPRTTTKTSTHKKCPPSASYVKYTSTHPQLSTTTHKICLSLPRSSKAYLHLPSPFMKMSKNMPLHTPTHPKYSSTHACPPIEKIHPTKIYLHATPPTQKKYPASRTHPKLTSTYLHASIKNVQSFPHTHNIPYLEPTIGTHT